MKTFWPWLKTELFRERPWPWAGIKMPTSISDLRIITLEHKKHRLEAEIAKDEEIARLKQEVQSLKVQAEKAKDPSKGSGWKYEEFLKEGMLR